MLKYQVVGDALMSFGSKKKADNQEKNKIKLAIPTPETCMHACMEQLARAVSIILRALVQVKG